MLKVKLKSYLVKIMKSQGIKKLSGQSGTDPTPIWTAVHSSNIKHKTKYKFNTQCCNSDDTLRSLTKTLYISNGATF